jgi:membrane-bound serine protease (ClpP class)
MSGRLIFAIISTLAEEAAIALLVLYLLPRWNIHLPLFLLATIMALWLLYAVLTYRAGTRALDRKQEHTAGLVGLKGEVVEALTPMGMVRMRGELWSAHAIEGSIAVGVKVEVLEQTGLKLLVKRAE